MVAQLKGLEDVQVDRNRHAEGKAAHEDPSQMEIVPNVYALGDCCASAAQPLPALAQVHLW